MMTATATSAFGARFFQEVSRTGNRNFRLFSTNISDKDKVVLRNFLKEFSVDYLAKSPLNVKYSRSSGPGGQNVNKVNTKVDLRLKVRDADWLPELVRERILERYASKITRDGELVVMSDQYRTQLKNHTDCVKKLHEMIFRAAIVPIGPSEATQDRVIKLAAQEKERRHQDKAHWSQVKASRRSGDWE